MIADARILVCISAHYVPERIPYLDLVLNSIATWSVDYAKVVLVTNDETLMEEPAITSQQSRFSEKGWELTHHTCGGLDHPFNLTWGHKPLIRRWLDTANEETDYFLYLEDDLVISDDNINYLLTTLPILKPHRLIPGFLRYEIVNERRFLVDLVEKQFKHRYKSLRVYGITYISPGNPYWAGFVLDKSLAAEYVDSNSFDMERSASVTDWDVRERAAMGLTWENWPKGFRSRIVVPFAALRPDEVCLIWHSAQNYNDNSASSLGKLDYEHSFVGHDFGLYVARASRKLKRRAKSWLGIKTA